MKKIKPLRIIAVNKKTKTITVQREDLWLRDLQKQAREIEHRLARLSVDKGSRIERARLTQQWEILKDKIATLELERTKEAK